MMLLNAELQLTMATGPRANAKMIRIFILFYPSSPAQSYEKFELTPIHKVPKTLYTSS